MMSDRLPLSTMPSLLFRSQIFVIIWITIIQCSAPEAPSAPSLKSWSYVIPESFQSKDVEKRLSQNDILCIGVYRLNAQGELYKSPSLTEQQRTMLRRLQKGRRLYPLISLRNAREGAQMLENPTAGEKASKSLIALMKSEGFDGLQIDFEYLTGKHSTVFARFLKRLKSDAAMKEKTLSIAAFPPLHGKPEEAAFYNLDELEPVVDEIVYMTYDYHVLKPGPVTHLYWTRQNLEIVRKKFPLKRVWVGVPSYGYEWKAAGRPRPVSEGEGLKQCERFGCERHDSGMLRVKRTDRTVFFSDDDLRRRMKDIAGEYGTLGTATWRAGFEK